MFPLEARLGRCCLLSLFVHSSELDRALARKLQKNRPAHVRYEGLVSSTSSANLGDIFSFVIGSGFFIRDAALSFASHFLQHHSPIGKCSVSM